MPKPEKPEDGVLSSLAKARLERATGGGNQALQAATLGLTFLGCLLVGYFAGSWLDARYKTSFWLPTLLFVGLAAGFVEAYRTLKSLSQDGDWTQKEDWKTPDSSRASGTPRPHAAPSQESKPQTMFSVPPPPLPEYKTQQEAAQERERADAELDTQDIIEKLLNDGKNPPHE